VVECCIEVGRTTSLKVWRGIVCSIDRETRELFPRRFQPPRNICGPLPVCMGDMAIIGRLHPMLVHFPIGLVLIAGAAGVVAMMTDVRAWRIVAVANVRIGAALGIGAAIAGWRLAS